MLLCVPQIAAGSLIAHALAYRVLLPEPETRAAAWVRTGHGYLHATPLWLTLSVALGLTSAVAWTLRASAGRAGRRLSTTSLALLPFVLFTAQELAEQFGTGLAVVDRLLEPTFLLGLVLQAPIALAAFVLARVIVRVAEGIRQLIVRASRPRRARRGRSFRPAPAPIDLPLLPVLALRRAGRAPPSFAR
jgi:hypothetical protein